MDVEPRFEPYTRSLFGAATLALDRDQRSAEENARLDALLTAFLQLLSGFFLSPGATKALEFLIRQYRCVLVLGSMGLFGVDWLEAAPLGLLVVQAIRALASHTPVKVPPGARHFYGHLLWSLAGKQPGRDNAV